jgi:hypothetical protein
MFILVQQSAGPLSCDSSRTMICSKTRRSAWATCPVMLRCQAAPCVPLDSDSQGLHWQEQWLRGLEPLRPRAAARERPASSEVRHGCAAPTSGIKRGCFTNTQARASCAELWPRCLAKPEKSASRDRGSTSLSLSLNLVVAMPVREPFSLTASRLAASDPVAPSMAAGKIVVPQSASTLRLCVHPDRRNRTRRKPRG